jgi:hypothetical protein
MYVLYMYVCVTYYVRTYVCMYVLRTYARIIYADMCLYMYVRVRTKPHLILIISNHTHTHTHIDIYNKNQTVKESAYNLRRKMADTDHATCDCMTGLCYMHFHVYTQWCSPATAMCTYRRTACRSDYNHH